MESERVGISTIEGNLNLSNPSYEAIADRVNAQNLRFEWFTPELKPNLAKALEIIPRLHRPSLEAPPFNMQATLITPKEKPEGKGKVGLVFMSGTYGTGPGVGSNAADLYRKFEDEGVGFSLGIGSQVSADTLDSNYSNSNAKSAVEKAAMIAGVLKNHPVENLYIIGHSLAGMDAVTTAALVDKLKEIEGIDGTQIKGLIMWEAGGQYDRGVIKFAKGMGSAAKAKFEAEEMYPTFENVMEYQKRFDNARLRGDENEIARASYQLDRVCQKFADPRNLSEEEKKELDRLNRELEDEQYGNRFVANSLKAEIRGLLLKTIPWGGRSEDSEEVKRLKKNRSEFLAPIMQRNFQGMDGRGHRGSNWLHVRAGRSTMIRAIENIAYILPAWKRKLNKYPTALVYGGKSSYFPSGEVFQSKRVAYPNAPFVVEADVYGYGHASLATNSRKFAAIVHNLVGKMETIDPAEARSNSPRYHY